MLGQTTDPLLAKAEQGIQAKIPAEQQDAFKKVISAGLTIMYSEKLTQQRNQRIAQSTDPAKEAGEGAARLISNLFQQSNKSIPPALIGPAANMFAFEWLDLIEKAGKTKVTPQMIDAATKATSDAVLPLIKPNDQSPGITPDTLQKLTGMTKQPGIIQQAQGA